MANGRRKRAATRKIGVEPISVWQALNHQPIVEITEEAAKGIFLIAAVILLAVWVMPYWGSTPSFNSSPLVGEERWGGNIAGAQIEISSTPEWYYVTAAIPGDVAEAFVDAATEVLDISGQVSQMGQFYEPGAEAVWNAWLELMADPY